MEKIVKKITVFIVFAICALFVLRCFMVSDKSTFKNLYVTDSLKTAFSDGNSQIKTVKVEREISEDGYFSAYAFFYNPETGEVQCAVRWNDSVYGYTQIEEGHEFSFCFLNEETGERFPAKAIDSAEKSIYNYRKIVADNVNLGDTARLTVVMELRDGFESTQIIRYGEQPLLDYKIPSKLQKELIGKTENDT